MKLERYEEAAKARSHAISSVRADGDPRSRPRRGADRRRQRRGQRGGQSRVRSPSPSTPPLKAWLHLRLAAEQDGKAAEAARIWREFSIAKALPDAPWLTVVREQLWSIPSAAPWYCCSPWGPGGPWLGRYRRRQPGHRPAAFADDQRHGELAGDLFRENGSDLDGWP